MNVHVTYISLLVLSFGFVAYLMFELGGVEEKFSKDSMALQSRLADVEKKEALVKDRLEKAEMNFMLLEKSYNEGKKLFESCSLERANEKAIMEKLKSQGDTLLQQVNGLVEKEDQCAGRLHQLQGQLDNHASGLQDCEVKRGQCEGDKVNYWNELQGLKQQSVCENENQRVSELEANLSACQQMSAQLELEKNGNWESFHKCSGDLQGCEQQKLTCETHVSTLQQQISPVTPPPQQQQQEQPPQQQQQQQEQPPQQQQQEQPPQQQPQK